MAIDFASEFRPDDTYETNKIDATDLITRTHKCVCAYLCDTENDAKIVAMQSALHDCKIFMQSRSIRT